ncbi:hypothetical protein [Nostoc flagelliforme]
MITSFLFFPLHPYPHTPLYPKASQIMDLRFSSVPFITVPKRVVEYTKARAIAQIPKLGKSNK